MATRGRVTGLVGTGCILAAGIGGYMAIRSAALVETETGAAAAAGMAPASAVSTPAAGSSRVQAPASTAPSEPIERAVAAPHDRIASAPPVPATSTPERTGRSATPPQTPASPVEGPVAASDRPTAGQPESVPAPPVATPAAAEPAPTPQGTPEPSPATVPVARFEELTVKANSVVGIRLDSAVSSETARVEDRVVARVARDVEVDGRTVIPEGTRLEGTVTLVDQGGRFRERARLEVRFHTLVLNTTRIPIETDRIFRDGEAPGREATSKIGASAVVGSILGAVIGGKKGAAIGGGVGAAGGTAAVMASGTNAAVMAAGSPYTVRLTSPVAVLVERDQDPR